MFAYISLTLGDTPHLSSFYISSKVSFNPLFFFHIHTLEIDHIFSQNYLSIWLVGLQVLLGLSGVVLVMLSVLGSVGFFSAIGVKSTLIIMEVIPFLVLAVSSTICRFHMMPDCIILDASSLFLWFGPCVKCGLWNKNFKPADSRK